MSREATGQISITTLTDGTHAYQLRFRDQGRRERVTLHERRDCECGCGGGWNERTVAVELKNILARVEAGVWRKREVAPPLSARRIPTFHQYASAWLQGKIDGTIGDRPVDPNTEADYRWRLSKHLLPYFAKYPLDEIDAPLCQAFKASKLREAAELREAIAAGAAVRDRSGRRARPLGPASIHKLISCLTAILDEAIEDGHIERNPARGRRMRVKVPKPARTFLEMDELVALTDAAGEQDAPIARVSRSRAAGAGATAKKVAERLAAGTRPSEIAIDLGLAKATVAYHVKRLGVDGLRDYVGRRAVVATLGGSGVRASELCDVHLRDVRLHDPSGARFRIRDSKTEAGIREVQVSPDLVEEIVAHQDRLRRAGLPSDPDAYLFPNVRGGRMSRQRVWEIVREAAQLATERLVARGLPPLPNTTPHSLRRTYISVALLANNFDVMWVMSQVGHADSKMTTDVYAQLQQRVRREHGQAFDALVRRARERLYGTVAESTEEPGTPSIGPRNGPRARTRPSRTSSTNGGTKQKGHDCALRGHSHRSAARQGNSCTLASPATHLRGNTGASTFRLSLAALLLDELDLHPSRRGAKVVLPASENRALSSWQHANLRITWVVQAEPWTHEPRVIDRLQPPLNLAGNTSHQFHQTMSEARAAFRAAASNGTNR